MRTRIWQEVELRREENDEVIDGCSTSTEQNRAEQQREEKSRAEQSRGAVKSGRE